MPDSEYYGVYIPVDTVDYVRSANEPLHVYVSREEAQKVTKEHKDARFKGFSTFDEAKYFAINGSLHGPANPAVLSERISCRSLQTTEIFEFRRLIENDDIEKVKLLICGNPRYLINIGDTPTLMRDRIRYNALHIAAKYNRAIIADHILSTIKNKNFSQELYGAAGDNTYLARQEVMVDLYLNTPDRTLNETPLHFASKYGSLDVIMVFIKYPQLQLHPKNKYGETPKDIVCRNMSSGNVRALTEQICKYLDEPYFVPVWAADDDVIQPLIGKPYSPKSPPVCPLEDSPLSPPMSIKAIAGPMNHNEASNFHKTWKSPAKNADTPHLSKGILLRSPRNLERGLETVGRSLAKKFHVSFKDYCPFLNQYVDLSSEDGLKLLETFLKKKFESNNTMEFCRMMRKKMDSSRRLIETTVPSPVSQLCDAFDKFSISSPNRAESRIEILKDGVKTSRFSSRRALVFDEDEPPSYGHDNAEVTDSSSTNCDINVCDNDKIDDDLEETYESLTNSIASSDDEYHSAEEGPGLFIDDEKGNKVDNAVLNILSDVEITVQRYPNIYLWKHSVLHRSRDGT